MMLRNPSHLSKGKMALMSWLDINFRHVFPFMSYPFDTPSGTSLATLVAIPKLCTTSTTSPEGL